MIGIILGIVVLGQSAALVYLLVRKLPKTDGQYIEDMMCHFTQSFESGYQMGKHGDPGLIGQSSTVQYHAEPELDDPIDEIEI